MSKLILLNFPVLKICGQWAPLWLSYSVYIPFSQELGTHLVLFTTLLIPRLKVFVCVADVAQSHTAYSPVFPYHELFFVQCSEADEISKICGIIGTPTKESWLDGLNLARAINYQFPQVCGKHLWVLDFIAFLWTCAHLTFIVLNYFAVCWCAFLRFATISKSWCCQPYKGWCLLFSTLVTLPFAMCFPDYDRLGICIY